MDQSDWHVPCTEFAQSRQSKQLGKCHHLQLASDVWKVGVDERLSLCIDRLDTSADDGNVGLNDAVFLQQIFDAHQVLAVFLRLQVHLPTTQTQTFV